MTELFDDGSSIEWVDKETLRYMEGDLSALIWVDFETGLFSSGRIIKSSTLSHWEQADGKDLEPIDGLKKQEIIKKAKKYYEKHGKTCQIE